MRLDLPRYVPIREMDRADGYLVEGEHVTPLKLIEGTASVAPSGSIMSPFKGGEEIAAVERTIAAVGRTHATVSPLGADGARVVAMGAIDGGVLEMNRHEIAKRKASAT